MLYGQEGDPGSRVLPPSRTPRDWKTLKRPPKRLFQTQQDNHYQAFLDIMHHIREQVNSPLVQEDKQRRTPYSVYVLSSHPEHINPIDPKYRNPFGSQQLEELLEKLGDWVNEILNTDNPDFYAWSDEQCFYEAVTNLRMLADTWNMVLGQYQREFSNMCVNTAHSEMDSFLQFLIVASRISLDLDDES